MKETFNLKSLKTFDLRKALSYEALYDMCQRTSKISFKVLNRNKKGLPNEYRIYYTNVKSIKGINSDKTPIYETNHRLNIKLEAKYPEPPAICYFETPIWHPNIKFSGSTKGHVCYNSNDMSSGYKLDELVEFIGMMIQYKNYHAILGQEPYPEDVEAAKWVTEYAEKEGLVNYKTGRAIDNSYLLDPLPGYEPKPLADLDWY